MVEVVGVVVVLVGVVVTGDVVGEPPQEVATTARAATATRRRLTTRVYARYPEDRPYLQSHKQPPADLSNPAHTPAAANLKTTCRHADESWV